jgi:hypothetical protein
MNEAPTITKRRVEVSIGKPDLLEDAPVEKNKAMPHHDECFFLTFVDVSEEDGGHNTLSAQTTCLCALKEATVAWLHGATEEEIKGVLTGNHEHGS